jgi:fucose 4-O-acetylase-like acetyltransferase
MDKRTDWVDIAKAIGIILVVYGHTARGIYNAGINIPVELYQLADSVVYSFHMPLFFFLSGLFFINSLEKRGGRAFVFSKVDTIVYPYIIWSIIQGFIEAFLSNYTNGSVTYSEVLNLFSEPRAQFWFLYALFVSFLLLALMFSFVSKRMAIPVFIASIILYLNPEILPDFFMFRFISSNLVFLMSGVVFSIYFAKLELGKFYIVFSFLIIFILLQFVFHIKLEFNYTDKGFSLLFLSTLSILFIISLSQYLSVYPLTQFNMLGNLSMQIYILHILAGSGLRVILKPILDNNYYGIYMVVGCLFGIYGPVFAVKIISSLKVPYVFSAPISKLITIK